MLRLSFLLWWDPVCRVSTATLWSTKSGNMWRCAQSFHSVSTCISGLISPALWLLSTKCILTIHSYNSTYCTLPLSVCVVHWVWLQEAPWGWRRKLHWCKLWTHTAVCIYLSVCVGGAEQQLNISLRTLLSDCCRERRGERGGVSVFDICIRSGITFLTSERSLIQTKRRQTPAWGREERTGRCWWRRVATEWMGRAGERQDCIPWKWGWSPWQLQLRVTWCGGVKEREMDKRVQKKSRQRAGLLALLWQRRRGRMDCRRREGERGSGTSVAMWFICSPPDYNDVTCVLSEKRNDKGYSERGDKEGWGRWRGKSSPHRSRS